MSDAFIHADTRARDVERVECARHMIYRRSVTRRLIRDDAGGNTDRVLVEEPRQV